MLRYPGGKTRAIKSLIHILEEEENLDLNQFKIYSPFYGGGSFEKYLHDYYDCVIYGNDLFEPLYNFWQCVKTHPEELTTAVQKLHPIDKESFAKLQKNLLKIKNNIKRAAAYFALNRSSFSGTTTSGGFSKQAGKGRFTQSSIDRIAKYDMQDIHMTNLDFVPFINTIPFEDNSLIFLDPPYYIESKLYGSKGDLHKGFKHDKLCEILADRYNWVLTYNRCDYIEKMYKKIDGVKIYDAKWSYGMNKSKKSNEIVIVRLSVECEDSIDKDIDEDSIDEDIDEDIDKDSIDEDSIDKDIDD